MRKLSPIWAASSRVGDRMSARQVPRSGRLAWQRQAVEDRQREGRGLAGAGLGDAEQVAALQQFGMAAAWIGVGIS